MLAKDVMTKPVITLDPAMNLREAASVLSTNRISGAPVVDDTGRLVGILTEHDLIRKGQELRVNMVKNPFSWVSPHTPTSEIANFTRGLCTVAEVSVEQAMTRKVLTVNETDSVDDVGRLMLRNKVNRVPVMSGGKLVGIITRANLVWAMVSLCEAQFSD